MTDEINIDNISHLPQSNIPPKDIPDNILLNTRKQLHQLDLEAKLEQERKDAEEEQKRKETKRNTDKIKKAKKNRTKTIIKNKRGNKIKGKRKEKKTNCLGPREGIIAQE